MRLALIQSNPVVGDLTGNVDRLVAAHAEAVDAGADLVCAPELALTGYPPEDLVYKPAFVTATQAALDNLAARTAPVPLIVGFVENVSEEPPEGHRLVLARTDRRQPVANSAAVCHDGQVVGCYRKHRLPNYGVFDEARYFEAGTEPMVVQLAGTRVGISICEDLWGDGGPVADASAAGAEVVLNLNASPYTRGKRGLREQWARHHARSGQVWIAYANCVGGQDEVVFDGDSFVMSPDGDVLARGAQLRPDVVVVDLPVGNSSVTAAVRADDTPRLDDLAEVYGALVLGTRDYVRKNGFDGALIGISGGIDSALVACIAADALGPEAVTLVSMPSPHSSAGSVDDAKALCANLGTHWLQLGISDAMAAFERTLAEPFAGTEPGVAEENLQSRIRGTLLMALSNKHGQMVLATGNKSEYAVGYATLYGDMAGGFAVIKDVPKTLVYELCRHRNAVAQTALIPTEILTKPPSAELRPDQLDTDSLPDYDTLDAILERYVEGDESTEQMVAAGFDADLVRRVVGLVDGAEYKRRQAAPGIKITARAFGKDRRLPITQAWSG